MRNLKYQGIIDELMFIARASEGAVSVEWLTQQPIDVRKKYLESFRKELEERKKMLEKNK